MKLVKRESRTVEGTSSTSSTSTCFKGPEMGWPANPPEAQRDPLGSRPNKQSSLGLQKRSAASDGSQ